MEGLTRERIERWAANRVLADRLLRDKAIEHARAISLLGEMSQASKEMEAICNECLESTETLWARLQDTEADLMRSERKLGIAKPLAVVGGVTITAGLIVGGIALANQIR